MAILVALFSKIRQIFSSYVLMTPEDSNASPFIIGSSLYSMPLIYLIILGCVVLIGYFCWQSYRQELNEEKLQEHAASSDENFTSYNLAWLNKLINWSYISSPSGTPDAIKRWMEDVNINLAKSESPIKILVYGIREGSVPPWIREIGQFQKVRDHVEIPVLFDVQEFGLTVSVQEEDGGKIIASTYTAVVTQFSCWYKAIISRIDGNVLAKLEPDLERPHTVNFNMKLLSDQKISTTVPEVVADMIKAGVLKTPFYVNVSTWGPVIPMTKTRRRSSNTPEKKLKRKDDNGNTISIKEHAAVGNFATPKAVHTLMPETETFSTPAANIDGDMQIRKSSTMPIETSRVLSDHLKAKNGLSGSLGSLVGIKRTPSGRGPAKPIRAREKRLIIKVINSNGLPNKGVLYCQATLDFPHQKCKTNPVESSSNLSWPNHDLTFDLSARSSEVKLVLYKTVNSNEQLADSAIASTVLYLDKINIDEATELSLPLKTVDKEPADIKIKLDFTENPVDVNCSRDLSQKFSSPRRSLDLSLISNHLPPMTDEKASYLKDRASTISSFSSDNLSLSGSQRDTSPSTTVRTETTKKVSPKRTSDRENIHISKNAPNMKENIGLELTLDVATVEGSVAETVMNDLSKDLSCKVAEPSPEVKGKIRGKVVITAIKKTNIESDADTEVQPITNGHEENTSDAENVKKTEKLATGDDMYYSLSSIETPTSSGTTSPRDEVVNKEPKQPVVEVEQPQEQSIDSVKPKKRHLRNSKRPKSLVSGVEAKHIPENNETKEWPKVRRSRSLIFGKGKKKQYKTGSATDLHKHANVKDDNASNGFEDDNTVVVPENELQKNKKKKSKSITKIFSKLGRRPSIKKTRKDSDIVEGEISFVEGGKSSRNNSLNNPGETEEHKNILITPPEKPGSSVGSESESFISDATATPSLSNSFNSSLTDDKSIKRSKSLRKRLFGGKRKTTKN
uniref:uncharacterized protein LOC120325788 isoform X1 n=1 Tax=Styela clava TaxID=7725 RepID=UPI00193AB6ED|nr:uncharacterized protein LOC120325788 isoform X1 [Styela clava]